MGTKTASRSAAGEREHHRTSLWAQLARFIGLFLAPLLGPLTAWLLHVWVVGLDVHWGPINWQISTSPAAVTVAVFLAAVATMGIAYLAWQFAEHRKAALRRSLAGSVLVVGALFAVNIGTGPHYWWSGILLVGEWGVAIIWTIARLDVARNDKTADDGEREGFLEKHGLKGWSARKVTPIADDKGRPLATEIEFQHAEGDTVDQLQDAVPAFESGTASPTGMSTATGTDRADRSTLRVMHRDPLIERQLLPPPSSPGGSIADGMAIGTYAYGTKVMVYIGGPSPRMPDGPASPSNYLFMGMTRAGKTVGENEMLTEIGTFRDAVVLYLNKSKGMQDLRPVVPIVEAAVIEADADTGGQYRSALAAVEKIMRYRQQQLGTFGVSAWSADECFHNPPWRTDPDTGKRVRMEPMPALVVHVGEADSILRSDGSRCQTIASKCLSLGVIIGFSMQRADHAQMPTGLRFNLGTSLCFGCSDDVSASFALSDATIKAGAHPENWKQRKPGYFYFEGLGIDETLFPVPARTFSGRGKNELAEELLARNLQWAPRMTKLDAGSVAATVDANGNVWWAEMVAATEQIRATLLGLPSANLTPADRGVADEDDEYTAELRTAKRTADPDDEDDFEFGEDETEEEAADRIEAERLEMEETMKELNRELRETTHIDGVPLYPADPITGERGSPDDATAPLSKAAPEDHVTWAEDRPAARDREAAISELRRVFVELLADESLRDPSDPTGHTVIVNAAMIWDRYGFRSRPWFADTIQKMSTGDIEIGGGLSLSQAPDLGVTKGKYRLQRDH